MAALNSKSLPSLKRACADALSTTADAFFLPRCFVAFNLLGDEDSAYSLADDMYPLRVGATAAQTEQIWIKNPDAEGPPQLITSRPAAAFRRDPRFLPLAERTGLLAYWRSGRLPDFCKVDHEPVCSQIARH